MLPGLKTIPAFNGSGSSGAGGGGAALSLSLAAFNTSTSSTISMPSEAVEGDWAILFDVGYLSGSESSVGAGTPTNWTQITTGTAIGGGSRLRLTTSYRHLSAGLAGTSVTGITGVSGTAKILVLFRPSTSIVSVVASSWNNEVTSGDPSSQTVTASGITAPLIVFACAGANIAAVPAFTTETPALTNLTAGVTNRGLRVGYTIYNSSPANQSVDMGDSGLNGLQSGYVRFT